MNEDSIMPQQQPQTATIRPIRETEHQTPTEARASRDAIGAIMDSFVAALATETRAAREMLDQIDETAIRHGARLKTELENFAGTIEAIREDTSGRNRSLDNLRALHARLVNARVE